jgi:AhpD family alkylhydroperoxidase
MTKFPLLDMDSAPKESIEWLEKAQQNFGLIPNVEKVMALSPQLLAGYTFMWDGFNTTSFTDEEKQVVYLTANYENECNYCVPWHTILAEQSGMSQFNVEALRGGGQLDDPKLNALSQFTRLLIANRGKLSVMQMNEFYDAGYSDKQALEVILALAVKLISNYTNSIAGTPLDKEAVAKLWHKPLVEAQEG